MDSSSSEGPSPQKRPVECGRPDLAGRLSAGEELSGTFGNEISRHAQNCPSCAVRLSLIQQAERWLADGVSANRASMRGTTPCPDAEELYDYGRGPGSSRLAASTERRVEAHLVDCEECRALVGTLAVPPPSPILDATEHGQDEGSPPEVVAPRPGRLASSRSPDRSNDADALRALAPRTRRSTRSRWRTWAAAAGLLVAGLWALRAWEVQGAGFDYPRVERLRGVESDSQFYPSGRVLAAGAAGTWQPLRFSMPERAGATAYQVKLHRQGDSLLGDSESIGERTSDSPSFIWDATPGATLAPGEYSWEAFATVNGLPQPLGKAVFHVIDAVEVRAELERRAARPTPQGTSDAIAWLVENKYWTDVRQIVLGLPKTEARDEFLESIAGR